MGGRLVEWVCPPRSSRRSQLLPLLMTIQSRSGCHISYTCHVVRDRLHDYNNCPLNRTSELWGRLSAWFLVEHWPLDLWHAANVEFFTLMTPNVYSIWKTRWRSRRLVMMVHATQLLIRERGAWHIVLAWVSRSIESSIIPKMPSFRAEEFCNLVPVFLL